MCIQKHIDTNISSYHPLSRLYKTAFKDMVLPDSLSRILLGMYSNFPLILLPQGGDRGESVELNWGTLFCGL